ncbi:MAG: precorrin-8X methylmutase [Desulfatitalea sp.]
MQPHEIERESFAIIEREAGPHDFSPAKWRIVQRMIHTTADFDYLHSVHFSSGAVAAGVAVIRAGGTVYTDTDMARVGINAQGLARFGGCAVCLMASPEIAQAALAAGTTRAQAAVDAVADRLAGAIYVVGNAPTALLRLIELVRQGRAKPALVVGLPVGFVNAAESKAWLLDQDVPYITNIGRKGGSNVAASVVNALILLAQEDEKRK